MINSVSPAKSAEKRREKKRAIDSTCYFIINAVFCLGCARGRVCTFWKKLHIHVEHTPKQAVTWMVVWKTLMKSLVKCCMILFLHANECFILFVFLAFPRGGGTLKRGFKYGRRGYRSISVSYSPQLFEVKFVCWPPDWHISFLSFGERGNIA